MATGDSINNAELQRDNRQMENYRKLQRKKILMTAKNKFCYLFFISFIKKSNTVSHCLDD